MARLTIILQSDDFVNDSMDTSIVTAARPPVEDSGVDECFVNLELRDCLGGKWPDGHFPPNALPIISPLTEHTLYVVGKG